MENQEIEIKFYVSDLPRVEAKLIQLGAHLVQPRTLEINLRFDTLDGTLARRYSVLRLRQDSAARITFKGPAQAQEGVRIHQEIEFVVEDFTRARLFLEALGYQVFLAYEKYRAVYDLGEVHVTLDEMPYGNFIELEGPDVPALQAVNQSLGLDWSAGIPISYTLLFEQLRQTKKFTFRDLSFENFSGLTITPHDLGVRPADA